MSFEFLLSPGPRWLDNTSRLWSISFLSLKTFFFFLTLKKYLWQQQNPRSGQGSAGGGAGLETRVARKGWLSGFPRPAGSDTDAASFSAFYMHRMVYRR